MNCNHNWETGWYGELFTFCTKCDRKKEDIENNQSTMEIKKTFTCTIHCGLKIRETGEVQSIELARQICQSFVDEKGECVSFTPTEYIYTNGNEPGVIVGFIQYPRFPREEDEIAARAIELADLLMVGLSQYKVTVICPDLTYMLENNQPTP